MSSRHPSDARRELDSANAAISMCAQILGTQRDLFERFMKESRDMENFGHIVDPTLFKSEERRAVEALLKPLYQAALDFLDAHDRQITAAKTALEKVNADG